MDTELPEFNFPGQSVVKEPESSWSSLWGPVSEPASEDMTLTGALPGTHVSEARAEGGCASQPALLAPALQNSTGSPVSSYTFYLQVVVDSIRRGPVSPKATILHN